MKESVVVSLSVAILAGCSSYHEVSSMADLEPGQRVVIGKVVPVEGEISDWVSGTYLGSDLVFADHVPLDDDGRPELSAFSGDDLSNGNSSFGSQGGIFSAGIDAREHFLLGIRAQTTHWLFSTTTLMPMIARIPPRIADCEYVGTFYVRPADGYLDFVIRDEFADNRATFATKVEGCRLMRNVAAAYRR